MQISGEGRQAHLKLFKPGRLSALAKLNEMLPDEVGRTCNRNFGSGSGRPAKKHGRFAHVALCALARHGSHSTGLVLKQARKTQNEVWEAACRHLRRLLAKVVAQEFCHVRHPEKVAHSEKPLPRSLRSTHGLKVQGSQVTHVNSAEAASWKSGNLSCQHAGDQLKRTRDRPRHLAASRLVFSRAYTSNPLKRAFRSLDQRGACCPS